LFNHVIEDFLVLLAKL
jgi:hypothetical protein